MTSPEDNNTVSTRLDSIKQFLSRHRWLLIVALATFAIRASYLYELSLHFGFRVPIVDEKWHWEWANNILNDSFWGEGAYFRAPLYPYLLAFLSWITGGSIFFSKLLQSLFACGTAIFVYLMANKLFNRTTAIVAGLAYACYGTLVFYETMFLIPALFLFLLTWGMYRLISRSESTLMRTWLVTGLIFGLAAIARPNVLLVVPLLMIWQFLRSSSASSLVTRLKFPVVLMVGVLMAVVPVTVRNAIVTGDFMLISSQGGINLHLGNNAYADGLTMIMPEVELDESVSWRQFGVVTRVAAEREAGREMSEAELSAFWTKKAVSFIVSNPGKFLSLVWKKSVYLVCGFENSDNTDIYYQRTKSRLLSLLLWNLDDWLYFPFGLLLPLALMGIYVHRDRRRDLAPLYFFVLAYSPTIVLFLVTARHRLPLIPFLIILAAAGVVKLVHARRGRSGREWIIIGLVFLVSVFVLNRTYYDLGSDNKFQIHFNNGLRYESTGDYVSAEKEYLLADQNYPFSATLLNNLAYSQFMLGRNEEADRSYRRGLQIDPAYAPLYSNLGLLVADKGEPDSALCLLRTALNKYDTAVTTPNDLVQVWLNIADVQEDLGELDSAAAAYHTAMTIAPEYAKPYKQGAAFFARYGGHHIMDSLYKVGRHFEDLTAIDYFNWGLSFIQRKRYTDGISKMMMALKENQNMHQAWYCIGLAYYEAREPRDSVYQFLDRCLEIDSSFQQALDLKALLEERGY